PPEELSRLPHVLLCPRALLVAQPRPILAVHQPRLGGLAVVLKGGPMVLPDAAPREVTVPQRQEAIRGVVLGGAPEPANRRLQIARHAIAPVKAQSELVLRLGVAGLSAAPQRLQAALVVFGRVGNLLRVVLEVLAQPVGVLGQLLQDGPVVLALVDEEELD